MTMRSNQHRTVVRLPRHSLKGRVIFRFKGCQLSLQMGCSAVVELLDYDVSGAGHVWEGSFDLAELESDQQGEP